MKTLPIIQPIRDTLKHLALAAAVAGLGASSAIAAPRFSVVTGNWNNSAIWSETSGGAPGASVPVAGDTVTIASGFNVTVTADAACDSVTFGTTTTTTLSINPGMTLSVSGTLTIPRPSGNNTVAVGDGFLNAGYIAFTAGGGTQRHFLTINHGTVTVAGDVYTVAGTTTSAVISFTGAGLLKAGGLFFPPAATLVGNGATANGGGTLNAGTGTVEYNGGAAQTVMAFAYNNLTLSGSGTKAMGIGVSATGMLTIAPTGSAIASVANGANLGMNMLTLGAAGQLNGTWGSTTATTATYQNDIYFAATTGMLTVANDSSPAGKDFLTFGPGATIDMVAQTVTWPVPAAPSVTALAPTYTLSPNASCVPPPGTTRDFSTPQTYMITAQNGSTKTYTVTASVLPMYNASKAMNVTASATGAEILNDAVLVEANHFFGGTAAPVTLANGLIFGTNYAHTTPAGWSGGQKTDTDAQGYVPLLTDATPFGNLMRRYTWSSVTNHYLNIPGLIPGHAYRLQLISVSPRTALVAVEGTANQTWTGTSPSVFTAIWTQSPGDTEANVVTTRGSNELLTNGYVLHDLSVLPAAPAGLAATPLVGEIRLNWTAAAGVAHYNVKRALAPGGPYPPESVIGMPTGPLFSDTSVSNGTTYYYVVSSVNIAGESVANSNEVSSTPTVTKADQSITFALGLSVSKTVDDSAFADVASATSLLPVTYSVHPADASVASVNPVTGMVTILRVPGTARILADQGGSAAFNRAPQVEQVLTVNQVMPVLTWATPRAIALGTALSATQLNATSTVPGIFTYTPAIGEVLAVGSHTLSVHFAPTEPVPYGTPADKTVTLTVGTAAGPSVINVNYGLASNASMNGIYSFDPVAKGSANRTAPAAYGGNVWNDVGGDTGATDLLDSFGVSTGVGFSWGPGAVTSPYNDWNGLGTNRMLVSGRFLSSPTYAAVFTFTGLKASHKYDLYIASLHNNGQTSVDFQAVGAATTALHCQYVNATDWVAGQDYVYFSEVEPVADGTLVVNAQRQTGDGYLNGFQLMDLGIDSDYNTWTLLYPGFSDTDPAHDPDGDGMSNQQEYAFGLDPTKGSSVSPVTVPLDSDTGMFRYTRRNPTLTGLTYTVLTSTNLMTWTPNGGGGSQTPDSPTADVQTVTVVVDATASGGRLFVRVEAQ